MRFVPSIFERLDKQFIGDDNRSNGRVSIEPLWMLGKTPPAYGGTIRGPYRWWQDQADSGVEWELPNVKSIEWDRSEDQDIASCTVTIYNMWHERNDAAPELTGQLGKPGYFWPKRGLDVNRWNQGPGLGAFRKDGFFDPNFNWQNVLIPNGLLRTYEGYGGHHTPSSFKSIDNNIANENVLQTGTWLIESITAGSDGTMTITCKDIGILLLKEFCLPPLVPDALYPVDYYPAGKSPFDSYFGTKPKTGVSPASFGEVYRTYHNSSLDEAQGVPNMNIGPHYGTHTCDGNWNTFGLSEAYAVPTDGIPWWQYTINSQISKLALKPWAGGYECFVSVWRGGAWVGSGEIPGASYPYAAKINIPLAIPDGMEQEVYVEFPSSMFESGAKSFHADIVRLTFRNLYYSGIPNDLGWMYRAGIREVTFLKEGANVNPFSPDFATQPWTFSMTAHPTRGYWVLDSNGTVHGFGDAADYDSSAFGQVPLSAVHPDNVAIAMKAHPSGTGYWVLDITGRVYAYGVGYFGQHIVPWPGTDKWGEDGVQAWDIAPTHTGEGYWVIYGDGTIKGFGDATSTGIPATINLPWTNVGLFMNSTVNPRYLYQRNGNGLTSHPKKMGFWATTGSGEVYAFGECVHYGQLSERTYNPGMADTFKLSSTEFTKSIESTTTGNGYWIAFGSGHIAAFGDALNQGKTYIYEEVPNFSIDLKTIQDAGLWGFFRALVWSIARDPDGTGFWVLVADGHVGHYNAEFWGNPGYNGKTGYRWHAGNFDGDYMGIIKEFLAWAGWTFYSPTATSLDIFGQLESTGISSEYPIGADKFDKRPVLDIIKELCEVVGYGFLIREDGGVRITSRNVWRSGNFDEDGYRIYVDGSSFDRVDEDDPNATEFIPLIDENVDLFSYSASLSGEAMRSEIIIGTDVPDPKNPVSTGFIRHTPMSAREMVRPDVPALRNIPSPAIWTNSMFTNAEEMKIMAELIDLNAWFSMRTGSATCVANPCLSIGDQVKFAERNTSEYNIHYIRGINSRHDLESGEWEMTITSNWLGDSDNWVITADNVSAPVSGLHYFQISEPVDRWQQKLALGLQKGAKAQGWSELSNIIQMSGEFLRSSMGVEGVGEQMWELNGSLTTYRRFDNLTVSVETLSEPLGNSVFFEIYNEANALVYRRQLSDLNRNYLLGIPIGTNAGRVDYKFKVVGYPGVVGNGLLKVTIRDNGVFKATVEDTLLIVG